jgi:hypothetical protein
MTLMATFAIEADFLQSGYERLAMPVAGAPA